MIRRVDIRDRKLAEEMLIVQRLSYEVEAAIIGYDDLPPLTDTACTLQRCGELFIGFYEKNELSGAISFKRENDELDIHRLIVHPKHFRKGIAQQLLIEVEKIEEIRLMKVSTGSKNTPAVNFYKKNGFVMVAETHINEWLSLSFFEKKLQGSR